MKWNDKIDPSTIPDDVLKSEWGRRTAARRKTRSGGRTRSKDRCPCGLFTKARAAQRRHVCVAPKGELKRKPKPLREPKPEPQLRGQWRGAPETPESRAALRNVVDHILEVTDEEIARRDSVK